MLGASRQRISTAFTTRPQLLFGLAWDMARPEAITAQDVLRAGLGAVLLVTGAFVILSRHA